MKKYKKNILSYILILNFAVIPKIVFAQSSNISGTINEFYKWALGIGGVAAVIMIVVGGIYFSVSGAADKKNEGKDYITSALWGLVLLFGAFLVLNTVNPQITKLQPPSGPNVKGVSCSAWPGIDACEQDENPYGESADTTGEPQCCIPSSLEPSTNSNCSTAEKRQACSEWQDVNVETKTTIFASDIVYCTSEDDCVNEFDHWPGNDQELSPGGGYLTNMFYLKSESPEDAKCKIYSWRTVSDSGWYDKQLYGVESC